MSNAKQPSPKPSPFAGVAQNIETAIGEYCFTSLPRVPADFGENQLKTMYPLKEPDMSDFENRPSGDYVDHSPNTYKEQYDIRTRQSERAKINEIVEWINKQEQTNEES